MDIELTRAIAGFRLNNEARGLSPRTTDWYDRNLKKFAEWLEKQLEENILLKSITPQQLRTFLTEQRLRPDCYTDHPYHPVQNRPLSPRSILGYYSSLSTFFNWAVAEEFLSQSPMANVSRPKVPKFIPDPFSREEIQEMLKACKLLSEKSGIRAMAIVLFLLDTGVRLSELIGLKLTNIDLEYGRAKVFGKGAKERFVYFGKSTRRALWRYISLVRPEALFGIENLFLTEDGDLLKQRHLGHILSRLAKAANVENVHPHRFRRTAAIQFLRNGGNIFALQKMLGHETLDMVRRYVDLTTDDVAEAHKKASPVDWWKL